MQSELQTALFQAFDTLNLQRVKTFSVPPVTLCGPGAVSSCGQQAQTRGLKHLFVMADSFLHQAGMTAGLTRSLAVKGIAMTLWPCPVGEPCITDVCAAVAQLRESGCDGVIAFGGGSVLDAAKAGDELAVDVMEVVGHYLGLALSQLALTVDPEIFVIGGGVSKAGQFLIDVIDKHYDKYMVISKNRPIIGLATLGNDAGIYGAARLILD